MSRRLIEHGLPWWSWTPKRVTKAIRSRDTVALVADYGRRFAGFAMMLFGEEHAHLNLLAVEPDLRRCGVGRGMVNWLEESCRVAGVVRISLELRASNMGALRFYRALGYDVHDQLPSYYCGRETAIRMLKEIGHLDFARPSAT
jgi:ribosomal protein S18 acetylase RimI-like enzyme